MITFVITLLETIVITLLDFGLDRRSNNCFFFMSFLIPYFISDIEAEPVVVKKAKNFIFFKSEDTHFFDISKFLAETSSVDYFFKVNEASDTQRFFLYEWFDYSRIKNYLHKKPFLVT